MPINTTCNHCGKSYTVSSSALGKRVRCKACQQPFTVTAGTAAARRPTAAAVAAQTGYALAEEVDESQVDWSPKAFAPSSAVTARVSRSAPPGSSLNKTIAVLSKFKPNVWVLLACTLYAAILGSHGNDYPALFWFSVYGFLALAVLFLLNGMTVAVLRAVASPQKVNLPWKDILLPIVTAGATFLLTGGLGYMIFYRRGAFNRKLSDRPRSKTVGEVLLVFGIAIMPVAMFLAAFANKAMPKSKDEIDRDAFYESIKENKPTPQMQHEAERKKMQQQQQDTPPQPDPAQQQILERLRQRRLHE